RARGEARDEEVAHVPSFALEGVVAGEDEPELDLAVGIGAEAERGQPPAQGVAAPAQAAVGEPVVEEPSGGSEDLPGGAAIRADLDVGAVVAVLRVEPLLEAEAALSHAAQIQRRELEEAVRGGRVGREGRDAPGVKRRVTAL